MTPGQYPLVSLMLPISNSPCWFMSLLIWIGHPFPLLKSVLWQVLHHGGAIAEVVQEYRSAPTHVPARLNTPATGAECQSGPTSEVHHLCAPQVPIQLERKQSTCTTMHNQQAHMQAREHESTILYHGQNSSVYSATSSKMGFSLVAELLGWLDARDPAAADRSLLEDERDPQ